MHWFVVPDVDGPVTGGTQYNRFLVMELRKLGFGCEAISLARACTMLAGSSPADCYWLDSLFLAKLPQLARAARPGAALGLIVHFLPSLLDCGGDLSSHRIEVAERAALKSAAMFLAPSELMGRVVRRFVVPHRPVLLVEPGRLAPGPTARPAQPIRAIVVANLVPGKRIVPLLDNLAEGVRPSDQLQVILVGGARLDPAHAEACRAAGRDPRLRGRLKWLGEQTPESTVRLMQESSLLLSASVMESYGMALAEARTLGLPIIAARGGNVASIVVPEAGGEVLPGPSEVATSCLALCRDHGEYRRRLALARARAWPARSWQTAALEFASQWSEASRRAEQRHAPVKDDGPRART